MTVSRGMQWAKPHEKSFPMANCAVVSVTVVNIVAFYSTPTALAQATVGVGAALIWDFCVAWTRPLRGIVVLLSRENRKRNVWMLEPLFCKLPSELHLQMRMGAGVKMRSSSLSVGHRTEVWSEL